MEKQTNPFTAKESELLDYVLQYAIDNSGGKMSAITDSMAAELKTIMLKYDLG